MKFHFQQKQQQKVDLEQAIYDKHVQLYYLNEKIINLTKDLTKKRKITLTSIEAYKKRGTLRKTNSGK